MTTKGPFLIDRRGSRGPSVHPRRTTRECDSVAAIDIETELREHMVSKLNGHCVACGELEPCARRQQLTNLLAEQGKMPRRIPGQASSIAAHGIGD